MGKGDLKHNNFKKKKRKKEKKRQRNNAQMKEQTRNTEIQINEEEIGKLPEKEFRIMKNLRGRYINCIQYTLQKRNMSLFV